MAQVWAPRANVHGVGDTRYDSVCFQVWDQRQKEKGNIKQDLGLVFRLICNFQVWYLCLAAVGVGF